MAFKLKQTTLPNPEIYYRINMETGEVTVIVLIDPIESVEEELKMMDIFSEAVDDVILSTPIPFIPLIYQKNIFSGNLANYKRFTFEPQ